MTTETTTVILELVEDDKKQLATVVQDNALPAETAQGLQQSFAPFFSKARSVLEKSRAIIVTDVSQVLEIKLARECRLALKGIRVAAENTRKKLKEESLRTGKAIDGFNNILLHLTESEEIRLEEQEKFAERKEATRKTALNQERVEALSPYGIDTSFYRLGEMTDGQFTELLTNTKIAHEAKIEAARKAEADRIAREQAEAAERERVRAENERLKREAVEKEAAFKAEREAAAKKQADEAARIRAEQEAFQKKAREEAAKAEATRKAAEETARKEREAIEAKAAADRKAREEAEAKVRQAQEVEASRVKAKQEATEKAASAPDREKLIIFAASIRALTLPNYSTPKGALVWATIQSQKEKFALWILKESEKL